MPMKAPLMPACIVINHLVTHTGNSTKFAQFNEQRALVRWKKISLRRSVLSQRHFTDKAAWNAMKYSRTIRWKNRNATRETHLYFMYSLLAENDPLRPTEREIETSFMISKDQTFNMIYRRSLHHTIVINDSLILHSLTIRLPTPSSFLLFTSIHFVDYSQCILYIQFSTMTNFE